MKIKLGSYTFLTLKMKVLQPPSPNIFKIYDFHSTLMATSLLWSVPYLTSKKSSAFRLCNYTQNNETLTQMCNHIQIIIAWILAKIRDLIMFLIMTLIMKLNLLTVADTRHCCGHCKNAQNRSLLIIYLYLTFSDSNFQVLHLLQSYDYD